MSRHYMSTSSIKAGPHVTDGTYRTQKLREGHRHLEISMTLARVHKIDINQMVKTIHHMGPVTRSQLLSVSFISFDDWNHKCASN